MEKVLKSVDMTFLPQKEIHRTIVAQLINENESKVSLTYQHLLN